MVAAAPPPPRKKVKSSQKKKGLLYSKRHLEFLVAHFELHLLRDEPKQSGTLKLTLEFVAVGVSNKIPFCLIARMTAILITVHLQMAEWTENGGSSTTTKKKSQVKSKEKKGLLYSKRHLEFLVAHFELHLLRDEPKQSRTLILTLEFVAVGVANKIPFCL
ncbi:hypothetical protein CEXT_703921 [Caerostris extrusa]|uniref:Uncharacterized protein n=1 Tax=Caerostris extrusa TaxID=172846 RepID=A0AAV4PDU6_CAEEX|nr:hypothetical protein CEXT_703921 [Caerostris extrusa]